MFLFIVITTNDQIFNFFEKPADLVNFFNQCWFQSPRWMPNDNGYQSSTLFLYYFIRFSKNEPLYWNLQQKVAKWKDHCDTFPLSIGILYLFLLWTLESRFILRCWENGTSWEIATEVFPDYPARQYQPWGGNRVDKTPFKLNDLVEVFVLFSGGCLLAMFCFIIELIFFISHTSVNWMTWNSWQN